MAHVGISGIFPGPRPPGRVSSEKNSILGTTHNAKRAPLGHSRRGRLMMGEYGKGPYGPAFMMHRCVVAGVPGLSTRASRHSSGHETETLPHRGGLRQDARPTAVRRMLARLDAAARKGELRRA